MKSKKRLPFDFRASEPSPLEPLRDDEPLELDGEPDAPEVDPDLDLDIYDAAEQALAEPDRSPEPEPASEPPPEVPPESLSSPRADLEPAPLADPDEGAAPALFGASPGPAASPGLSLASVNKIRDPRAGPIYGAALVVSVLWALAPIAYAVGYRQGVAPLQNDAFALTVFALLAAGPVALVWIAAFVLNQGLKLAGEARRTRALAEQMLAPAALAATGAQDSVALVRAEIDHAADVAAQARDKMLALGEALAHESERLAEATAVSARTAQSLSRELAGERDAMSGLAATLDAQSAAVADAINRQAKMVAEASDLAETQLREAEAALAARAADMAAAAGEASDAARIGAEDLARQIARLETAGVGVSEQIRVVDEGLTEQRAALLSVAHALRAGQEDFSVQAETQVAQLTEYLTHAKMSAGDLGEVARRSAEAISELTAATGAQFRDMAEAARDEREALTEQVAFGFARIGDAAAAQRAALEVELSRALEALVQAGEQARAAADSHVAVVQGRIDRLGEAAFVAGQKADAVFEARLGDARNLIETSAQMVEQAAAGAAQKLEAGVEAARAAVAELERLLNAVNARVVDLPHEAQSKAAEVKAAVEKGVDELLASARKAADETQAIDAAFQDRVRRNYDMLSEAARMMGAVAGSAPGLSPAASRLAAAFPPKPRKADAAPEAAPPPEPEAAAPPPKPAEPAPRPRLRLTPTASDAEFSALFDAAGGKSPPPQPASPAEAERDWSWKDLLETIDEAAAPGEERLAERLAGEIGAMGIDPAALLPKARIEEIAAAVQTRDEAGARAVVKSLAPAAIRRLVRKLFSDAALRDDAERFRRRYGGMIAEAADKDRQGFLVQALLASEAGRTWLLLDTAAGDLA
jgi:hypothetical protein